MTWPSIVVIDDVWPGVVVVVVDDVARRHCRRALVGSHWAMTWHVEHGCSWWMEAFEGEVEVLARAGLPGLAWVHDIACKSG
jgi:hypothetical protein